MTRIAVLGLGAMGSRIAQRLIAADYSLILYNRTTDRVQPLLEQGAVYAPTPQEAAAQADVVISMVTNDEASRMVWSDASTGAVLGLKPGAIAIESSTLTVEWTKELAAAIQGTGAAFLDAPVVGSRPQADDGKLIYLVGGDAETLAQVQPILQTVGGAVHQVGPTGRGMAMKLAVNALFGIQVAALAEVLGMLAQQEISPAAAMACLGEIPVTSLAAKGAGSLMAAQNHAPLFPIDLVEKDFRYAIQTAQADRMPVSMAIHRVYQAAISQGYGNENITGVANLFLGSGSPVQT